MVGREIGEVNHTAFVDGKRTKAMPLALLGQVAGGMPGQRELAKLVFDGRFPDRRYAKEDIVLRVLESGANGRGDVLATGGVPEEYVRVGEQPHEVSNDSITCSGRGLSKSPGTVNSPAQSPNGRGSRAGW